MSGTRNMDVGMRKSASKSDFELMRGIMAAIRVARARYGVLEDTKGYIVEVGGVKVPVVNSERFPSPACLSRSLVEGTLPDGERPPEMEHASPADPVVAMTPRFRGNGYDTVLFHELVHSQQIHRMWRRHGIDHSEMSHGEVVEGWRDRSMRIPKSPHVDEEYGSVHGEIHAYMMHAAYAAIRKAADRMRGGWTQERAEEAAVKEAADGGAELLAMLRNATMTMPQDLRFVNFMRRPAAEYGVDMGQMAVKPRWRMGEEEWNRLKARMGERMEFLVRKMVRDIGDRDGRRTASIISPGLWEKVGASAGWMLSIASSDGDEGGWDPVADGRCTDNDREWRVSDLIRHAQDIPVTMMGVDGLLDFNGELNVKGRLLSEEMDDPSAGFMNRVRRADLEYPILVSTEGWVLDGAHRLAKAKWDGMEEISVKVVDLDHVAHGGCRGDGR